MHQTGLLRIVLCLMLWVYFPASGVAADIPRLKVGLVLSGGGARGAAHVGVLKVLEDLHVPVDAVAGTSMGAIIGGLYASGLSAAEIEQVLGAIDWGDAFHNDQPRPDLSFRRKEDDFSFLIDFDLGFREGRFLLPKGVIYGQKQNRILRALLWPNLTVENFDALPIPYRAIATDVITGETRVIAAGSMGNAIQASMSFPGIFSPVAMGKDLLVDGGISNNLPVDVVRSMGVDVLIVVDVSAPLYSPAELKTALEITDQVSNVLIRQNTRRQIEALSENDIFVTPELTGINSSDFSSILAGVKPGEVAATKLASRLQALALTPQEYQQYVQRKLAKGRKSTVSIDAIRINTTSRISPEVIQTRVQVQSGQPLRLTQLEDDLARIFGMQYFERVSADITEAHDKTYLDITADRKSWGPNYLNFGVDLTDDFAGGSEYNLLARLTKTEINALAAEWRNDIQIGESPRFVSEFYQPLSTDSRYFSAASLLYEQGTLNVFDQGNRLAEFRVTSKEVNLELGREFGNWGELRVGVRRGEGVRSLRIGVQDSQNPLEVPFDIGQYVLHLRYDKLDNVRFPLHGARIELDVQLSRPDLQAATAFDLYRLSWIHAGTRGRHTFLTRFAYGTITHDTDLNPENRFRLGGFLNLSGLSTGELNGPHYTLANLVFYRRLGAVEKSVFNTPVYLGGSLEAGNVWQTRVERDFSNMILAGSLFIGVDTFLGPIYLAAGLTDDGQNAFYFSLGRSF